MSDSSADEPKFEVSLNSSDSVDSEAPHASSPEAAPSAPAPSNDAAPDGAKSGSGAADQSPAPNGEADSEADDEGGSSDDGLATDIPDTFSMTVECSQLKAFVDGINPIADEVIIKVTDDGVHAQAVDPANVAMVDLTLTAAAIQSLSATGFKFGLDIQSLKESLSAFDKDDAVSISAADGKLRIAGESLQFTRGQPDIEYVRTPPEIPEFAFDVTATLAGDFLAQVKQATAIVDEAIDIAWDGTLTMAATGATDSVNITPQPEEINVVDRSSEDASVLLDRTFLAPIIGAFPTGADITIALSESKPVKLAYTGAEGELSGQYMVAPKIPDDE